MFLISNLQFFLVELDHFVFPRQLLTQMIDLFLVTACSGNIGLYKLVPVSHRSRRAFVELYPHRNFI